MAFKKLFDLENSFWTTTKTLILKPELVIRGYLNGATKLYYNPVRFVFIAIAVSFLVMTFSGFQESDMTEFSSQNELSEMTDNQKAFQDNFMDATMKYMNILSLFLIPFLAFSTWLFFRRHKIFYAEHLAINSYGLGIATIIGIPLTAMSGYMGNLMTFGMMSSLVIMILYYIYFFQRIWKQGLVLSSIKSFLTIVIGYFLYLILFMIVGLLFAFFFMNVKS